MKQGKAILTSIKRSIKYLIPADEERFKIMVMCFATAMIFWFFNALNKEYRTDITYPIVFQYDNPEDYTVMRPLQENLTLEIKGGGWRLLTLFLDYSPKTFPVFLSQQDLQKSLATNSLMPSLRSFFKDEHDISVLGILPAEIPLDIEPKVEKKLTAYINTPQLRLGNKVRLGSIPNVTPKYISVRGAESVISELPDSISVFPSEEIINENIDEIIPIELPEDENIEIHPSKVRVRINVYNVSRLQHRVTVIPVHFPKGYTLKNDITWITFTVLENQPERFSDQDFIVEADFRKMKPDSTIIPELVQFPSNVESVMLDTAKVRVAHTK